MTIHKLSRFGLLTKETTSVLRTLIDRNDFKAAEASIFKNGMTHSRLHANRLLIEIKNRTLVEMRNVPKLVDLIAIAKSNASPSVMSQIYFVYLYYTDDFVAHITDKLGDIFSANLEKPDISRDMIMTLLVHYLQSRTIDPGTKTISNWIGRYLSVMREANLLVRKKNNEYFINFLGIQPSTWLFFTLHAHFNNYRVVEAEFLKAFQIKPALLPKLLEQFSGVKSAIYKMVKGENDILDVIVETTYRKLNDWIADMK